MLNFIIFASNSVIVSHWITGNRHEENIQFETNSITQALLYLKRYNVQLNGAKYLPCNPPDTTKLMID